MSGIMTLFEGEDLKELSEEFKGKVETLFEAAVSAKVAQKVEEIESDYETKLEEQAETAIKDMTQKIDDYLSYVAEQWMKDNELSIDAGIRNEITDSFLGGLKDLFTEHYVEIPEDKVDVVTEMSESVDTLESEKNEVVNENIDLKKQIAQLQKDKIVTELSEDLADSEVDKLNVLVGEIVFEDAESFRDKVCTIAETFLGKTLVEAEEDDDDDDDDDDDEKKDDKKGKKKPPFVKESDDIVSQYAARM